MRSAMILVLSVLAFLVASPGFVGDSIGEAAQVVQHAPAATEFAMAVQAPDGGGAAAQTPLQTRSMRPYWHVFLAFAAVWLLLFGYALTVGRRFGRLEEEVRRLRSQP